MKKEMKKKKRFQERERNRGKEEPTYMNSKQALPKKKKQWNQKNIKKLLLKKTFHKSKWTFIVKEHYSTTQKNHHLCIDQ